MSSTCLVALVSLNVLAAPAPDDLPVYRWKFERGRTFYQEHITETKQTMKVNGADLAQTQRQTFYYAFTPLREEAGGWVLLQHIEGVKLEIDIGGNKINYDSTRQDAGGNNPLGDFFKALAGAELRVTLDRDMKVVKVEGGAELLKRLPADPQMEATLKHCLNEDALKEMAAATFGALPGREVQRGESWTRFSRLDMGPVGRTFVSYEYVHAGREGPFVKFKVENIDYRHEPPRGDAAAGLPFKITRCDFKTRGSSGTILFDPIKGRVDRAETTLELQGRLTIDIGGAGTDVELHQAQKVTVRTTDAHPVRR